MKGDSQVATLSIGDYFGEVSLLKAEQARSATVRSVSSKLCALSIKRDKFQELGLNEKLQFPRRPAVVGQGDKVPAADAGKNADMMKTLKMKSAEQIKLIENAIQKNQNLASLVTLHKERLQGLSDAAWQKYVPSGETIRKVFATY